MGFSLHGFSFQKKKSLHGSKILFLFARNKILGIFICTGLITIQNKSWKIPYAVVPRLGDEITEFTNRGCQTHG